jgi:hypothetical protein
VTDALNSSWSPWVSGAIIGLMVPGLYLIVGRRFGLSSSLRHIGSICAPNAKSEYLRLHNWRDHSWNLVFVGGLIVGAFAASNFMTANPLPVLPGAADSVGGVIRLAFGGALVGFGTRYAGGCTSGHTITGISNLNLPSVVATVAFFAGGLISTWALPFLIFAGS